MREVSRRKSFWYHMILAAIVLIGLPMTSGWQSRINGPPIMGADESVHAPSPSFPTDLAVPGHSSLRALVSAFSNGRSGADRVRHFFCDGDPDRSVKHKSQVDTQSRILLNYCSTLTLVQSGSISHLATSVPPPARSN